MFVLKHQTLEAEDRMKKITRNEINFRFCYDQEWSRSKSPLRFNNKIIKWIHWINFDSNDLFWLLNLRGYFDLDRNRIGGSFWKWTWDLSHPKGESSKLNYDITSRKLLFLNHTKHDPATCILYFMFLEKNISIEMCN